MGTRATLESDVPAERLWQVWSDVEGWPRWDHCLESVELEGPFAAWSPGTLKPRGGRPVPFVLTAVEEGRRFADSTLLPLASLEVEHELGERDGRARVTHRVRVRGPLSPLCARVIGRQIAADFPVTLAGLVEEARAR